MYEMSILLIQMIYICEYYPILSITERRYRFSLDVCLLYEEDVRIKNIDVPLIFYVSDKIQIGRI
jgi:hypothetical protein